MSFLIRDGLVVTQNKNRDVVQADVLIENDKIKKIDKNINPAGHEIINAENKFVIPGLIQAHTHLCQTLFRGRADDLSLLDWLKKRIWPMESRHTERTLKASAELGLLEMQMAGTTTIVDMPTTKHTDAIFETARRSGIRYFGGNCLMDIKKFSGPLYQDTQSAIKDTENLFKSFHRPSELIHFVLNPRFVVCCSDDILQYCLEKQKAWNVKIHIHASENKDEIQIVKKRTKKSNVDFLDSMGFLNPNTIVVHGVHLTDSEIKKMVKTKTPLVHCPSANLKLASGIAPIARYLKSKMLVALGNDGAACNNTMDPFQEMRVAALLQKPFAGPRSLPAQQAFDLLTVNGAKALGLQDQIGSIEAGKNADIVLVNRTNPTLATVPNPLSALVYSCTGQDVSDVMINGQFIVRNKIHQRFEQTKVIAHATEALRHLDI